MHPIARVAVAFSLSTLVVLGGFLALVWPGTGRFGEMILWPGAVLPISYWGALHDPVQFLVAGFLNMIFYTICFLILSFAKNRLWMSAKDRGK
jgi:hypothetical protein